MLKMLIRKNKKNSGSKPEREGSRDMSAELIKRNAELLNQLRELQK